MEPNWNYHFTKSKKLFHQGKYQQTLEELKVCLGGVEKEFTSIENLPTEKAKEVTLRFSNVIYWRTLCFYSVGKKCCARKNVYYIYDQIRSIFLNPNFEGHFRNILRVELKRITDLYIGHREETGPDNLINDFERIYYTKILI